MQVVRPPHESGWIDQSRILMVLPPYDEKAAMNGADFVPRTVAGLVMKPVGFLAGDGQQQRQCNASSSCLTARYFERQDAYLVALR
jgi:hypothetical protein